jgi:hypothetical protein
LVFPTLTIRLRIQCRKLIWKFSHEAECWLLFREHAIGVRCVGEHAQVITVANPGNGNAFIARFPLGSGPIKGIPSSAMI